MGWFWNRGLHGSGSFCVKSGTAFAVHAGLSSLLVSGQVAWMVPGCVELLDLRAAGDFTSYLGYRWGRVPEGWNGQKNWIHPVSGSLRVTDVWSLSWGSQDQGHRHGAWNRTFQSVDALRAESEFSFRENLGALAQLGGWGVVDPESTWVESRSLVKALKWEAQEPLWWSRCFLSFTASKVWQKVSGQSYFQHCVLDARWLMERTLRMFARLSDD